MKKILKVIAAIMLLTTSCAAFSACKKEPEFQYREYTEKEKLAARATQLAQSTLNNYVSQEIYAEGEILMLESFNPWTKEASGEASVWHYTSVLAMTNRLVAISEGENKAYFDKYNADLIEEMRWYKGSKEITSYNSNMERTMYAVDRALNKDKAVIGGVAAVYDDQMWIIRELLSAYANTGTAAYLAEAEALTDTCLDGWDTSINPDTCTEFGGITWGPGYKSKHTCSNAPLVAPLVDLYFLYKDKSDEIGGVNKAEYYLNWAKKIYSFSYATFKNENGLYGDLIGSTQYYGDDGLKYTTAHGTLDATEYTYNTGTMLSGAAKLYSATNDATYLRDAQNSAEAAYEIFGIKDENTGLSEYPTTSTLWFNFELLLGFVDLAYVDDSEYRAVNKTYVDSFRDAINYAYDHYYHDGFLPRSYVQGWVYGSEFDVDKNVMDCAAAAETYALLYQYYTSDVAK